MSGNVNIDETVAGEPAGLAAVAWPNDVGAEVRRIAVTDIAVLAESAGHVGWNRRYLIAKPKSDSGSSGRDRSVGLGLPLIRQGVCSRSRRRMLGRRNNDGVCNE